MRIVFETSAYNPRTGQVEPALYHLHPEFIDSEPGTDETAFFCSKCHGHLLNHVIPPHSLANGLDLGDCERIGLKKPNAFELSLLARVRHYHSIVKIQQNGGSSFRVDTTGHKIRSHSILFEHDAPQISCLALIMKLAEADRPQLKQLLSDQITIQFVGPDDQMDYLIKHAIGSDVIRARADVLYSWLLVLRTTNPLYSNDPPLPSFNHFKNLNTDTNETIFRQAVHISDEETLRFEASLDDDANAI